MNRVTGHIRLETHRTYKDRETGERVTVGRKEPTWYMKYRDANGHQVQKRLGPDWGKKKGRPPEGYFTEKTANDALNDKLAQARAGTLPDSRPTGRTFGEACAEYLRYVEVERRAKPSTLTGYRSVNRILLDEFGRDTPLHKITTERIEQYKAEMFNDGELTPRTIQKRLIQLHGILKRARQKKWIVENPAEPIDRVKLKPSGDFNVLSLPQVEAVARAAASEQDATLIRVAAYTGLRLGELRALRWLDVDFTTANVFVRQNYTQGGYGTPKSGRVRSVPLIDQAAAPLDQLSRREHFTDPDDLVFGADVGTPRDEGEIRDAFYAALRDAGLGHLRKKPDPMVFHDLRHTFGTLAAQTWPIADVKAYMGHADLQTTQRYVHHIPKVQAAAELSEAVRRALGADDEVVSTEMEVAA